MKNGVLVKSLFRPAICMYGSEILAFNKRKRKLKLKWPKQIYLSGREV